jgi:hypothetical protein
MSFEQKMIITFVDKGLLSLAIACIGFVPNSLLVQQQAKPMFNKPLRQCVSKLLLNYGQRWRNSDSLRASFSKRVA